MRTIERDNSALLTGLADLLPPPRRHLSGRREVAERLRWCVHPDFYAAQLSEADRQEGTGEPAVEWAIRHWIEHGARANKRLSAFFNPAWYDARLAESGSAEPDDEVPFLHWLTVGWERRIVPTPLFDPLWYLEQHPTLRTHPRWIFHHYLTRGCYLPSFVPSPTGIHHGGERDDAAAAAHRPLLLPEMLYRAEDFDLTRTSWLETGVEAALADRRRLESGPLHETIERTAALEPLIHLPKRRQLPVSSPVRRHPRLRAAGEAESARRAIGLDHVDTIILVPHCRMGGAARVSGLFSCAVAAANGDDQVLIVATDLPAFERPDWFPPKVKVFDLTRFTEGMAEGLRRQVLLDLVRGLTPRRIVNINSSLAWSMFLGYGEHLSTLSELGVYLFTWDVDSDGQRAGYPIMHFQRTFEHLSWVLMDSERLRQELVDRYLMSEEWQSKLVLARTPVYDACKDVVGTFAARRRAGEPLRAMWAGRFDRQKRFDLVVDVALAMPDLEVWAWGKAVLNDLDVDLSSLPPNIRLMGVYDDFDDLPLTEVDFMLYTAEWDGVPTLVLDAAQRGIPLVASAVGGVPEVVTDATGYPVKDVGDSYAYVSAIKRLVADPDGATRRAAAMKARIAQMFAPAKYQQVVDELVRDAEEGA